MTQEVIRRFELHPDEAEALDDVEKALRLAVQGRAQVILGEVKKVRRPPLLEVSLRGVGSATSAVMAATLERVPGARILRDVVEVPFDAPRAPVYPDPLPSLRIGVVPASERQPAARSTRSATTPVTIAVIDSGMMVDHPDLKDNLWEGGIEDQRAHGARFAEGSLADYDVTDDEGHGTMLAGTILATADGGPAVRLMPLKFFDAATIPDANNAAAAIDFAVKHHAHIINLSWDVGLGSEALESAIRRACDAGALVVIAAGNDGSDSEDYPSVPASYANVHRDRVITVMATDRYDERAWFSNYGDAVDLAAPGVGIVSTRPHLPTAEDGEISGNGSARYQAYSGTSAACAHVTGAAALLKAQTPSLTAEKLKRYLLDSVDRVPGLRCASGGRLNLGAALSRLAQKGPPPSTP